MAWIEVHQSLPTHRKTIHAAAVLNISPVQMVGHLVCLWLWALDNAPEGVMHTTHSSLRNRMVANVSQWDGDPEVFVGALVEAGLLVEGEDGLAIHDWHDYAGKLIEARKANRERQRRYRAAKKKAEENHTDQSQVTRDATVTDGERNAPTVPNHTLPNSTVPSTNNVGKRFADDSIPMILARHLRNEILNQDPNTKVPQDLTNWAVEADRMIRLDKRDHQEAARLITWAQNDPFWQANILSMAKFRKQYDTLKRQAVSRSTTTHSRTGREPIVQRMLREELARERGEIIDI